MNIEKLRAYCLAKKGSSESFPFDETTLVFKVLDKMFALTNLDGEIRKLSLKTDPEIAIERREEFDAVTSAFHMNNKHWNSVELNNTVPDNIIQQWIDESYQLVTTKFTKANKKILEGLT